MKRPKRPKILGVTLASPAFLDLAVEAVRRWRDMTGEECIIITPPEDAAAHMVKLRIPQLVRPGPICFFDADLWFLRPCKPWELLSDGFIAVKDCGVRNPSTFAFSDCQTLRIDPDRYFNSGFFVCDTSRDGVRSAFAIALNLAVQRRAVKDFGEQSYLNAGVQRVSTFHAAPDEWNVGPWAGIAGLQDTLPARPIGLHALGVPGHLKRERLELWERAFSPGLAPDLKPYGNYAAS